MHVVRFVFASQVRGRVVSKPEECEVECAQPDRDVPLFKPGIRYSEEYEGGSHQGVKFAIGRMGGGDGKHLEADL